MAKPTQFQVLMHLASEADFFHDQQREPFAVIKVGGHSETHRLRERGFKRWLVAKMYKAMGTAPNAEALGQALNTLEAQAVNDGARHELQYRVTQRVPAVYYDLADEAWRVVAVDRHGWRVTGDAFLFRRGANTAAQGEPVRGGDLAEVLDFVNLTSDDDRVLFLIYLVTCLIPEIPHPVLMVSAEKGAGKSTLTRVVRRLLDPADEELLCLPNEPNELALLLARNYVAAFDNLDGLQGWQSDYLSRAATGGGITKRRLYTDDEEVILKFRRCVVLNGINPAASRPDLLDRTIHFTMERIPPKARREEREFWAAFEETRPRIFGAMLTALSGAMKLYPSIELKEKPRMADFAAWGYAAADAIGIGGRVFLDAYWRAVGRQNEVAIEGHPVASAVVALLRDRENWEGTPAELLTSLEKIAEAEKIDTRARTWPKAAHILTRRLNEVKSNLLEVGITFEKPPKSGDRRVVLRRSGENAARSAQASEGETFRALPQDGTADASDAAVATDDESVRSGVRSNRPKTLELDAPDAVDATFPHSSEPPWKAEESEERDYHGA